MRCAEREEGRRGGVSVDFPAGSLVDKKRGPMINLFQRNLVDVMY